MLNAILKVRKVDDIACSLVRLRRATRLQLRQRLGLLQRSLATIFQRVRFLFTRLLAASILLHLCDKVKIIIRVFI